jgi:dipeptidase E
MKAQQRQIIAMGGGGFSSEPENPALDIYILKQARVRNPKVCFVGTATGDAVRYIANFYRAYRQLECVPTHLSFFERTPDLRSLALEQDVIYVGGGNTKSMLAVWREWGFDLILKEAWESGVVLAGISAGAICWFEQGITDSFAGELKEMDCLGFLKGSCCPHYDGEVDRRPSFHRLLKEKRIRPGYALDDGAAVHFGGDELNRVVVSRREAHAYRMQMQDGSVQEEPLQSEFLEIATPG